jgi:hypothetical protein
MILSNNLEIFAPEQAITGRFQRTVSCVNAGPD